MVKRVLLAHGMTWYAPGSFGCQWFCSPTSVGLGHFGSGVFRNRSLSFSFSSVDRSVDKRCADYNSPFVMDSISNWRNIAEFLRPTRPMAKVGRQPAPAGRGPGQPETIMIQRRPEAHAGPQPVTRYRRPASVRADAGLSRGDRRAPASGTAGGAGCGRNRSRPYAMTHGRRRSAGRPSDTHARSKIQAG